MFRTIAITIAIATLPAIAAGSDNYGTKVNRFQLIARALQYPGLYSAALEYMKAVSFPKNDVITCYWDASHGTDDIFITNILPNTTRSLHFSKNEEGSWKVTEK